jgi:hypothetical protein
MASTWRIELDVRDDAPSMFVPADLLPDASPGDAVVVRSANPPATRAGVVQAVLDDDARGRFVTVSFGG